MPAQNESLPDAPSNIEQRRLADENTGESDITPHEQRRASNIRDYHQAQIKEAEKAIAAHQKIVDQQNVILGEVEDEADEGDVDSTSPDAPLANGTDISERFHDLKAGDNEDQEGGIGNNDDGDEFTDDDEFTEDDESDDESDDDEFSSRTPPLPPHPDNQE